MATRLNAEGAHRSGSHEPWMIPLDQIVVPEQNLARYEEPPEDVFEQWYQDYKRDGQHTAAFVQLLPDRRVRLVDGKQRLKAHLRLEKETGQPHPLLVTIYRGNDEESFYRAVSANKDRIPPTPMDEAFQAREMRDRYGKSAKEIAEYFHKSESWVSGRLNLLVLEEKERKLIHTGFLKDQGAQILAKLVPELREETIRVAAEIEGEKRGETITVPGITDPGAESAHVEKKAKRKKQGGEISTGSLLEAAQRTGALQGGPERKTKEIKAYLEGHIERFGKGAPSSQFYAELLKFIKRGNSEKQLDNRADQYLNHGTVKGAGKK